MPPAATMSAPVVPPRPSRSPMKEAPKVPPRPSRSKVRDLSPDDRFAPSPLNDGFAKSPKATRFSPNNEVAEFIHDPALDVDTLAPSRPVMARMPSEIGDEGLEYGMAEKIEEDHMRQKPSPTAETRTVGDLELQAPRPSLPTKVDAVTSTTSEFAASLGLNKSAGSDVATIGSLRKKASTSALSNDGMPLPEDEHGIPEIGRRVPMIPNAGDVQAPESKESSAAQSRAQSTRGLPPGSYGLHSHGVFAKDKLETEYYEKRPDILQKEQRAASYYPHQSEYARSSADLNKIVRQTSTDDAGPSCGPTEDIAHEVHEEFVSHASPEHSRAQSPETTRNHRISMVGSDGVHVDRITLDHSTEAEAMPILASDQIVKEPTSHHNSTPAIEVEHHSRSDELKSQVSLESSSSTPFSAGSIPEIHEEKVYEPLFSDNASEVKKSSPGSDSVHAHRQKFPSKDIWEDAPSSAYYTAEVNTPVEKEGEELAQTEKVEGDKENEDEVEYEEPPQPVKTEASSVKSKEPPNPALAFAKLQEKLAEDEAKSRESTPIHSQTFLPRGVGMQPKSPGFAAMTPDHFRPTSTSRFPSRDIWEDTPDSHMMSTTVDSDQEAALQEAEEIESPVVDSKTDLPVMPARPNGSKPPAVDRSKPKPPVADKPKSAISEKPKPVIPARPNVARPVGGKIAALQSGFMSDLNRRLQIGPQAPKKEEPSAIAAEEAPAVEKVPLTDARKGRARGPQRRAPAKAAVPAIKEEEAQVTFSISRPQLFWSIGGSGKIEFEGTVNPVAEAAKPVVAAAAAAAAESVVAPVVAPSEVAKEVTDGSVAEVDAVEETPAKTATEADATVVEDAPAPSDADIVEAEPKMVDVKAPVQAEAEVEVEVEGSAEAEKSEKADKTEPVTV
ncbi:hypothetical protein BROUX41_003468 [Berkeleyomyces rouxiae]